MSSIPEILWRTAMQSSIWLESPATRIVWMTMLMLKDKDGIVSCGSVAVLAHAANVSFEECQEAIDKFLAPDPNCVSESPEGRRIEQVQGGWRILGYESQQLSTAQKRALWALQKREQRQRMKR